MNYPKGLYLIECIHIICFSFGQLLPMNNGFSIEKITPSKESFSPSTFKRFLWKTPSVVNDSKVIHYIPSNSSMNLHRQKSYKRFVPILDVDEQKSLFGDWVSNPLQKEGNNVSINKEKESQIAEVFFGVAYGTPLIKTSQSNNLHTSNKVKKENEMHQYLSLIQPSGFPNGHFSEPDLRMAPERIRKNSYLIQQPNQGQHSLNIFKEKPESLVREIPSQRINFSLPQLFVSIGKSSLFQHPISPTTAETNHFQRENTTNKQKDLFSYKENKNRFIIHTKVLNSTHRNRISSEENISFSRSNITNESDSFSWLFIRSSYPYAWMYHDYLALILFSLLSLFPLLILLRVHLKKKNHITPRYCSLLMVQLLIVCIIRVVLYSVDPFAVRGRLPYMVVSLLNDVIHSILICSVGIFLIILMFPVYRPKSQLFPRLFTCFLLILMFIKMGIYFVSSLQKERVLINNVRTLISAVNFGENGILAIGYIFLNLCTRQRHKIWWIRIYKKSWISSNNYTFNVLYSKLKQSIRCGSYAAIIHLFITLLGIITEFDFKRLYFSLFSSDSRFFWIEESSKRLFEYLVCIFLICGAHLLFAPKMRSVIKKRSAFKSFMDIIKGKRRTRSKCCNGRKRRSLKIFTLNRHSEAPDYVAKDFQLVWNQSRTLPLKSLSDKEIRKSAKSLDFVVSSLSHFDKKNIPNKLSHSVDILSNIEGKTLPNSFAFYDNLKASKNQMPIYQNQYFHYNYEPKIPEHDNQVCLTKKGKPCANESKKKNRKKMRPKSYVEERKKIDDNYLTSYFSVLSMDRSVDSNLKDYGSMSLQNENRMTWENIHHTPLLFEEINSPMISTEKWKDIKITPKFCTIKINSKNVKKKLASSKSVDLF